MSGALVAAEESGRGSDGRSDGIANRRDESAECGGRDHTADVATSGSIVWPLYTGRWRIGGSSGEEFWVHTRQSERSD